MDYNIGSSPHTRGARHTKLCYASVTGIIPAYAGSTPTDLFSSRTDRDHPRIRGEHSHGLFAFPELGGSSPHTRGAPPDVRIWGLSSWIIPAYAGSTDWDYDNDDYKRDHPRIRGEHDSLPSSSGLGAGSSPHTRGARGRPAPRPARPGIIPAYAGSTRPRRLPGPGDRDHPRIRGEHTAGVRLLAVVSGSSPHTRGARRVRGRLVRGCGIIPAYAGSTVPPPRLVHRLRDHPRIRGEHPGGGWHWNCALGSSPHTRGAHRRRRTPNQNNRIIPAYAGSTFPGICATQDTTDHPRIRGEHGVLRGGPAVGERIIPAYAGSTIVGSIGMVIGWGSSPHTRGAPVDFGDTGVVGGIIPAYAGSTTLEVSRVHLIPDHPRIRGEHSSANS